jgi:hypothetical protein
MLLPFVPAVDGGGFGELVSLLFASGAYPRTTFTPEK